MPPSPLILADECVHREIVARLRFAGYEVNAVAEGYASTRDGDVLALAVASRAILITNDRDFGELIFRERQRPPSCILYVRVRNRPPEDIAARLVAILAEATYDGNLIVIDDAETRRRSFPSEN